MNLPLNHEISYTDPARIFSAFSDQFGAVLLESAELRKGCGRYSFIGIDPFLYLTSKGECIELIDQNGKQKIQGNPFEKLELELKPFSLAVHPLLPPFQGGVMGYFGYELCHHLEKLHFTTTDTGHFPDMALGFYDLVIGFDHAVQRAWIFSSGYPLQEQAARNERAIERCQWLLAKLQAIPDQLPKSTSVCAVENIQANFAEQSYQAAVSRVVDYILAGDIFEANISQAFKAMLPENLSPFELYCRLRYLNPAPFAAYLNFSDVVIASASPERFLRLTQNQVEARPIKGTSRRSKIVSEDTALAEALLANEKDRAENIMIVDLLRNDISKVCQEGSVQVTQLCGLESYATVHHLVSVVTGKLKTHYNAIDVLRAAFPGGSITGAPKIRAMEIIAEIEKQSRGPYCGSIGYIGFNGDMDSSITIRTFAIKDRQVMFQAGGAIVADSDPLAEYNETLIKASALCQALTKVI